MNWCTTCGAQYSDPTHNCGWTMITKDRLRELEDVERAFVPSPLDGGSGRSRALDSRLSPEVLS